MYIYILGMVRTTVMSLSFELDINSKIHEKLMRIINVMQVHSVRAVKFYVQPVSVRDFTVPGYPMCTT